jgi:hypothetical protein
VSRLINDPIDAPTSRYAREDRRSIELPDVLDPERLAAALGGSSRIDSQLVESLGMAARQLPRQWGDLPCSTLWRLVHAQLMAFDALLSDRMPGRLRRDLESAAAATAAFAGQISIFGGQQKNAASYLRLAARLANDAGDDETHALALMFSSHLHSNAFLGGQMAGNGTEARTLLEAAERLARSPTAAIAHAWVLLCRAEERAGSNDEIQAWRLVDEAERLFSAGPVPADGICCHWGAHLLATYRGHVALMSNHADQAVSPLESALAALRPGALMIRSAARADLSRAYVSLGDIDHACHLLAEAFELAQRAGLTGPMPSILRIRRHDLGPHAMDPAVRWLDSKLSMAG